MYWQGKAEHNEETSTTMSQQNQHNQQQTVRWSAQPNSQPLQSRGNQNTDTTAKMLALVRAINSRNVREKRAQGQFLAQFRNKVGQLTKMVDDHSVSQLQSKLAQMKAMHQQQLRQKEETIEKLRAYVTGLDEQRTRQTELNATLLHRKAETDAEILQMKNMKQEINMLNLTIADLTLRVESEAVKQEEIISISQKLSKKEEQVELLTKALEEKHAISALVPYLKQEKQELKQQISLLKQANEESSKVIDRLENEVLEAKIWLREKQADIQRLMANTRVSELQKLLDESNKQIEKIKSKMEITETPKRLYQFKSFSQESENTQINKLLSSQLPQSFHEIKPLEEHFSSSSSEDQQQQQAAQQRERQSGGSYGSKDKQEDILEVELEILKCKYKLLEKMYVELKHQSQGSIQSERMEIGVQTEDKDEDLVGESVNDQADEQNPRNSLSVSQRPLKKTLSGDNLHLQENNNNLDISIVDSLKGHKTSTLHSPAASLYNFSTFFNSSDLQTKIKNFNFQSSILHKISTSKFITSPSSKVAFVFQYACFLEMYFSPEFLSVVMEELVMGDQIEPRKIGSAELNRQLVDDDKKEEGSFLSQASSRSNKLNIAKQFSMNSFARVDDQRTTHKVTLGYSFKQVQEYFQSKQISLSQRIHKLQSNLQQIRQFLQEQHTDIKTLTQKPALAQKLSKLAHNEVAQTVLRLIRQNDAVKKCLNQMIKNEELLTKTSNEVYFDRVQADEAAMAAIEQHPHRTNCTIM